MTEAPIRTEMIQSHLAQLRQSLGARPPVVSDQLRVLFDQQDYTGMVKLVRDSLNLDVRLRVGFVNNGGPVNAVAWGSYS
jgi:hypothetical protein